MDEKVIAAECISGSEGSAKFRGFPVECREIVVAGIHFKIASMADATHLLDEPDFANRFLESDMAPYGVELWPAAIMLADHLAEHHREPQRALELGCGLALVSLVAARLGWSVVAADHEPSALVFARHNAAINGVTSVCFETLDWNKPVKAARFSRILGADILYQLNNHAPILQCVNGLLEPEGVALISDPNRGVADPFPEMASEAGFHVEVHPAAAPGQNGKIQPGRIFRLSRTHDRVETGA